MGGSWETGDRPVGCSSPELWIIKLMKISNNGENCGLSIRWQKKLSVEEVAPYAAKAHSAVAAEYRGLTVAELTAFTYSRKRNRCLFARC